MCVGRSVRNGRGIGGGRGRGVLIDYRRKWEGLRFIFCWFNVVIGPLLFGSKQRTMGIVIPLSLAIPFGSLRLLASFTLLASLIVHSLLFFLLTLCFLGGFRRFVGLNKLNYAGAVGGFSL